MKKILSLALAVSILAPQAAFSEIKVLLHSHAALNTRFFNTAPQAEFNGEVPGKNGVVTYVDKQDLGTEYTPERTEVYESVIDDDITTRQYKDHEYFRILGVTYVRWYAKTERKWQITKTHKIVDRPAYVRSQGRAWGLGTGITTGVVLGLTAGLITGALSKARSHPALIGLGIGAAVAALTGTGAGFLASSMAKADAEQAPALWKDNPYIHREVLQYHR